MSAITRASAYRPHVSILTRPGLVGILLGLCDMAVAFTYAQGFSQSTFYAATLAFKLVLILGVASTRTSRPHLINASLIGLLLVGGFAGVHNLTVLPTGAQQLIGFCAHLILTGNTLEEEDIEPYSVTIAVLLVFVILLFLWAIVKGKVTVTSTLRFSFFHDNQPNLGGEIILAGVFMAGIGMPAGWFLAVSLLALPPLLLLQARSALLAVGYLQLLCVAFLVIDWKSQIGKLLLFIAAFAFMIMFAPQIVKVADFAFQLSDANRGLGSGFTGRAELWQFAMNAFLDSPIFGQGYGFFEAVGSIGAHNLLLFILSEYGLLGLGIVGWMVNGIVRLGRLREIAWLLSFVAMALFNDRFINLNPYPFFYYVMMWIPAEFISVRCLHRRTKVAAERLGAPVTIVAPAAL